MGMRYGVRRGRSWLALAAAGSVAVVAWAARGLRHEVLAWRGARPAGLALAPRSAPAKGETSAPEREAGPDVPGRHTRPAVAPSAQDAPSIAGVERATVEAPSERVEPASQTRTLPPQELRRAIEDLRHDRVRRNATIAVADLLHGGPEVVPALQGALASDDHQQRLLAAALLAFRPDTCPTRPQVAVLIDALRDNDVRNDASLGMRALSVLGEAALPHVEATLPGEDPQQATLLAHWLGHFAPGHPLAHRLSGRELAKRQLLSQDHCQQTLERQAGPLPHRSAFPARVVLYQR